MTITTPRLARPLIPITDKRFKYVPACATNVARTWRKFRLLARLQGAQT